MNLYLRLDNFGVPFSNRPFLNLFSYIGNNPINDIDFDGLLPRNDWKWPMVHSRVQDTLNQQLNNYFNNLTFSINNDGISYTAPSGLPTIQGQCLERTVNSFADAFADSVQSDNIDLNPFNPHVKDKSTVIKDIQNHHPDWPWDKWNYVFK